MTTPLALSLALLATAVATSATATQSRAAEDEVAAVQVGLNVHDLKRAASAREPYRQELHNFMDMEYSGDLEIGGQTLRAIYDTGSFELLVVSKHCKSWSCKNNKGYFEPEASHNFHAGTWTKTHKFGSGECKSRMSDDLVRIGNSEIRSSGQSFWEVTEADMNILLDGSFGAILGLGDPKTPVDDLQKFLTEDLELKDKYVTDNTSVPGWLRDQEDGDRDFLTFMRTKPTLLQQLGVTKFSVCFLRGPKTPGYFVWNDVDPATLGGLMQKIPITGKNTWTTLLENVIFEDTDRSKVDCHGNSGDYGGSEELGGCTALLDTGTSLIAAPTEAVNRLQELLKNLGGDACRNLHRMPHLTIKVNGVDLAFPPESYIGKTTGTVPSSLAKFFRHLQDGGGCDLMMMSIDITEEGRPLWILGMPFFREFYTTFDLGNDGHFTQDVTTRAVHVGQADQECTHPKDHIDNMVADRSEVEPRVFDLSKVRVPGWAQRAHKIRSLRKFA